MEIKQRLENKKIKKNIIFLENRIQTKLIKFNTEPREK